MVRRKALAALSLLILSCAWFGYGCRKDANTPLPALFPTASSSAARPVVAPASSVGARCPAPSSSVPHGTAADGRIDATACDAWPKRQEEPKALSRLETAQACAVLGACGGELLAQAIANDERIAKDPGLATAACPRAAMWFEERAIPFGPFAERWSYFARALLKEPDPCTAVSRQLTTRIGDLQCQEVGCYDEDSDGNAAGFSCRGSVAERKVANRVETRDCSRAHARCDPSSPTGCTDRTIVSCEPPIPDRCDGAFKIGCDGEGRLSFHDCSLIPAGICLQTDKGAKCVSQDSKPCDSAKEGCDGNRLTLCVQGEATQVDCAALGLGTCVKGEGTKAHCAKK